MSKKKSLGSSPIGFQTENSSMGFIPDLGVSKSPKNLSSLNGETNKKVLSASKEEKAEKKIVSYNLEVDLIDQVKSLANKKEIYYSSLVSIALKSWMAKNN